MNIFVAGGSGLLGTYFQRALAQHEIRFSAPSSQELNLAHTQKVRQFFGSRSFDIIVNCAAYTKVEEAESAHREAETGNITLVKNLIATGVPMIHFSTDYVFGNFPPFTEIEEDYPRFPINYYGGTKLRGELLLELESTQDWWNIRTSWLFGGHDCFVSKIIERSKTQKNLSFIHDQIGRPTYAKDLVTFVIKHFILADKKPDTGHYHLQNTGSVTHWAEFADYFLTQYYADRLDQKPTIETLQAEFWPFVADRPKNSVLKNTKLLDSLRDWRVAVDDFIGLMIQDS